MQTRMGLGLGLGMTRGGGGGVFTPNFFVDSTRPNDSGDGLTLATAKQTLTAGEALLADNQSLGLVKGSLWRETLSFTQNGTTVDSVGTGELPLVDGAGAVTETWAQHDAGTFPNTWNIDVTHGWTVANGRMMIWEDGVMLKRVTSIALVNAEAGTYFSPGDNVWTGASSYKIYVHATGSGNPNSNGKFYERTQRQKVLHGAYGGLTGTVARDIITGRQGDNDGSIVLGKGSTIERVLAYDGHKHNALQESGICKNSAFINAQPETNYLHVFYTPTATGSDTAVYEGNVFVGQTNGLRGTSAVFCHDNSGQAHATLTLTCNLFANVSNGIAGEPVTLTAVGSYIKNANSAFANIASSTTTLSHLLANKVYLRSSFSAAGTHTISQSAIYTYENFTFLQMSLANWGNVLMEQTTLHMGDWGGTVSSFERNIVNRTTGTGTFSMNRCIHLCTNANGTFTTVLKLNTASIGTINNNVYYMTGNFTKSRMRWVVDGVNKTFAEWQALGHDLNSIVLDQTDIAFADLMNGQVSDGDFRLKSTVSLTLPDLTPISELGVQEHYNFNTRQVVAGAPSSWPTMPETYADGLEYVEAPTAWEFYP